MKKAVCLVVCLCMLGFVGCDTLAESDPVKTLCGADVVTVSTGEYLCSMEMSETGCTFRFASPEILQPLVVTYDGTALHAVYDSMETDVANGFAGGLLPLYHAVCAFETGASVQRSKNIRAVTLDETEYLLYYDTEGGMPTRLETKGADGSFGYDVLSCTVNDDNAESSRTDTNE